MAWVAHETIGPMLWGRTDPYIPNLPVIGSQLIRFRQRFVSYHRPWRAGIVVSQYHAQHGIVRRVRLPVVLNEFLVKEFRYPPEIAESGQELFDLIIRPYGRWRTEANWLLDIEVWS